METNKPISEIVPKDTYGDLIKTQAYMIQHQQDLLNNYMKRNADLIQILNQYETENAELKKTIQYQAARGSGVH